jgi:hypothetical protein
MLGRKQNGGCVPRDVCVCAGSEAGHERNRNTVFDPHELSTLGETFATLERGKRLVRGSSGNKNWE